MSRTTDQDLIDLAGDKSYQNFAGKDFIQVNGKNYKVLDVINDKNTGLNAITVKNVMTGECTIVYQGTQTTDPNTGNFDIADIMTDASLPGNIPDKQMKQAESYYQKMNKKFGISSVTGNSLGGGLANFVAVQHPKVHSATFNPAIIPGIPEGKYNNITNYLSDLDPLTLGENALSYTNKIPGRTVHVNTSLRSASTMGVNHIGYADVVIGEEGETGHGIIHIEADDLLPVSIWGDKILVADYSGSGKRIKVDTNAMKILAQKVNSGILENIKSAQEYLDHAADIVNEEGTKLDERESKLQISFDNLLVSAFNFPKLMADGNEVVFKLRTVEDIINQIQGILGPLAIVIPTSALGFLVAEGIERIVNSIREDLEELMRRVKKIKEVDVPKLFRGVDDHFFDGIVEQLQAHYQIIDSNKEKVTSQVSEFGQLVFITASEMVKADKLYQGGAKPEATPVPVPTKFMLEASPYLMSGSEIKQKLLDANFKDFSKGVCHNLRPVLSVLRGNLEFASGLVEGVIQGMNTVCVILEAAKYSPAGLLLRGQIDDVIQTIRANKSVLEDIQLTIKAVIQGMQRMEEDIEEVLKAYRPYIDASLFEGTRYIDVLEYNKASANIYTNTELIFKDVKYQLAENESAAIEALDMVAVGIVGNLNTVLEQIERATIH